MAKFPSKPQKGQKALQAIYNSLNEVIDYLPSLEVRGDNKTTSVSHSNAGTTVHANISISTPLGNGKLYDAGSGLTLSGNVFHNAVTSGRFIEITTGYAINCTLSGGNGIQITPNGIINCTVTPGGGGNTYYADNYTLSTTTESGNTFCLYDVYPLITGGGGITVSRYGDAPLYPYNALGTIITCPYYVGSGAIGIIDGAEGTYVKYIAITGDIDYHAGTGISIDPETRTINCTVEPGGGGTYYADESTIKLSSNNTFYLYNIEPVLTGRGGTGVAHYGTDEIGRQITAVSSYIFLPSTGIAILDDTTPGTYNKYLAVTGSFIDSSYYNFTNGLSTYNILDANNNVIGQNVGLVETYRTILNTLSGSTLNANHNKVLSSSNDGTISWQTNTASSPTWSSLTPSLLAVDNNNHTLSAATQSGGGGGGMPWPNYANLDNSTGNTIMLRTRYQAGDTGGWLRISYKGQMTDDCYYVKIGPDGNNDPQIGLWRIQNGYGYYGQIGNTWLLPVPPNNYIYVSFPNGVTTAWFDASLSQDSPQPIPPSAYNYPADIEYNRGVVYDYKNAAYGYKNEAEEKEGYVNDSDNYDDADYYASEAEQNANYAEGAADEANNYATDSETKNTELVSYGINSSTATTQETRQLATEAQGYATQARQAATRARAAANAFPH